MASPTSTEDLALAARKAYQASQLIAASERVNVLRAIKSALEASKEQILAANKLDVDAARVEVEAGRMSESLFKRLDLNKGDKWDSMLQGLEDVANLPDPTGKLTYAKELDDGLELYRVSCPIGVLLVIFEARPEVVVNIASLAIKSGNAAILKGGKESMHSATELASAIQNGLSKTSLPSTYIQAISTRAEVSSLLACTQYIDLVIPRGSNELVSYIQNNTRIPVMGHADGLCAVFVDKSADKDKAVRVVVDSKVDYPAACNAAETLLLHQDVVRSLWPMIAQELASRSVTLLCDEISIQALTETSKSWPSGLTRHIGKTRPDSFDTEHLSLTISVKVVESIEAAINHVNTHGSHHTDCIVTEDQNNAQKWCSGIDSAGTFVNASTRFADGFRYGFGTEVGIATGRIHARGPVGLEGLCTYKYILKSKTSSGHIVGEFGSGKKQYTHLDLPPGQAPF